MNDVDMRRGGIIPGFFSCSAHGISDTKREKEAGKRQEEIASPLLGRGFSYQKLTVTASSGYY